MENKGFSVIFKPSGHSVAVSEGLPLSQAAHEAGIPIDSSCGGRGKCGKCRARIQEGKLSDPTPSERSLITPQDLESGHFLLCQRTALSDCVVESGGPEAPESRNSLDKGILMDLPAGADPPFSKAFVELPPPTPEDAGADLERIFRKLQRSLKIDPDLLPRIPSVMRQSNFKPTLVFHEDELITVEAGDTSREAYGIAFDIGTTTVAGYLVDLARGKVLRTASAANRQGRHGADVISRISHAKAERDGVRELQSLVAETVEGIIRQILDDSRVPPERIYGLVFTGNTVMMHFLLGTTPENIALAPFVPAFTSSMTGRASQLGLQGLPSCARFITLPNVAGYVGADTVSVMVATRIHERAGNWLAIDIGTNGEVVLSSKGRLLTCSTAAGPAFEGGSISHGMRAVQGAVYKADFSSEPIYSVVGGGEARGLCGSGLLDAVYEMARTGILHRSGRILSQMECPAGLPGSLKERIEKTDSGIRFVLVNGRAEVSVTQKDIREVQLAKGAIRAGVEILLKEAGITSSDLNGILLAGAFGSNLRPESILGIGLLPPLPVELVTPVGNAAGTGAVMALLSRKDLELASTLASRTEHVELSLSSDFQRLFIRSMDF